MDIHRHVGELFGGFCLMLIVWHVLTPGNPDHVLNLVVHTALTTVFFVSSRMSRRVCRVVHPAALLLGAAITAVFGNFPVAAFIAFLSILLYYAYSGFSTLSRIKSVTTFAVVFAMFFAAVMVSGYDMVNAYGTALVWASGAFGAFWVIWLIINFSAHDLVQQNRDLLEQLKKVSKGVCADVATTRG